MPTVLITGASRGIGRGFVDRFNEAGWRVISTCRDPGSAGLGGEVHLLDVTEQASVDALVTTLKGEPIDLLLNNAGIYGPRTYAYDEIDYDVWAEVLSIDAMAPIRVAAALTENVAASNRKLMVFISSVMGSIAETATGEGMIYRSSKACLNAAVNVMSHGLQGHGIACVLFHPGWVRTDMGGPTAAIDTTTSVRGMFDIIDGLQAKDNGRFINYDGTDIPW
jgi:NAD(P)-dependent dehydrogenase (short-subunit alcohol dehydrogenase family)